MMNPQEFANIARTEEAFWWFAGMQKILLQVLEQTWRDELPDSVLEVGGGTGYFAQRLAQHFHLDVHMADLAAEGLSYARQRGLQYLLQADMRKLPVRDECFDAVICLDALVHLDPGQEAGAFRELHRVLRKRGWLVVRVSALDILRSRHSQFTHERQRFTRGRLVGLAEDNGLTVERCTYLNTLLLPVALAKFRVWEPLIGNEAKSGLAPVHSWVNTLLQGALEAERVWIKCGGSFPVGQSLLLVARKQ